MSGSGGGRDDGYPLGGSSPIGGGSGSGAGPTGSDPCAIAQRAPLNSPRPAIVATISIGDILRVELNESGTRPILEVVAKAGLAGALTHNGHIRLIDCIRQGYRYEAVVVGRTGGAVDLQVQPA